MKESQYKDNDRERFCSPLNAFSDGVLMCLSKIGLLGCK